MLKTVVRPTPKGMFVGNMDAELHGVDDELAATLIAEGKAAAIDYDAAVADDAGDDAGDIADLTAPLLDDAGKPVDVPEGDLQADVAAGGELVSAAPDAAPAADKPKNKGGRPPRKPDAAPAAGEEAPAA